MCTDLRSYRCRTIATLLISGAAVLGIWTEAGAGAGQDQYVIYYFDEPRPFPLDMSQVAVYALGALPAERARELAGYGIQAADVEELVVADWAKALTPDDVRTAADVERLVGRIADESNLDFVSPVFFDEYGLAAIITPEILVRFDPQVGARQAEAILANTLDGEITHRDWARMVGAYRVTMNSRNGFDVLAAANALAARADVMWAEPNLLAQGRQEVIPNDTRFGNLWGIRNTGQFGGLNDFDMDGDEAWDTSIGSGSITVVILDDGVQQNHPDLHQLSGNDLTGNGTGGGPFNACDRHGTTVAGCVSATYNNNLGVVGIAPGCFVRSAKFNVKNMPCTGSFSFFFSDLVDALDWAQTIGAEVTNNSNSHSSSASITNKYSATRTAGIIHFASAGNAGVNTINYPANLSTVNAVTSVNDNGNFGGHNFGTGLAFSAPGIAIDTTDRTGADGFFAGDYGFLDGTSYASPYSAGVAALVRSVADLSVDDVETVMQTSATDLGAVGYDTTFGWGLVNARAAIDDGIALLCGSAAGNCYESNGSTGCNDSDCCETVCQVDPFCCRVTWDSICVSGAFTVCGNCGDPGAGACFISNGTPGCDMDICCETICVSDPFCCNVFWDSICANSAVATCVPDNDGCTDAIEVFPGDQVNGNVTLASNDGATTCGFSSSNPDVWYTFTASVDGTLRANTCGTHDAAGVDTGMDTVLSVHSGCPGTSGNTLACNDDWPTGSDPSACTGADTGLFRDSAVARAMSGGETVLIRISHFGASIADGAFILNIEYEATNDACADAIQVFSGNQVTGDLDKATNDGATTCGASSSNPDLWYTFTAPGDGTLRANTCGTHDAAGVDTGMDTVLSVHSGCPGTSGNTLGCNDDWPFGSDPVACTGTDVGIRRDSAVAVPLSAGQTVVIRISHFGGAIADGAFVLNVDFQPVNDNCADRVAIFNGATPFSNVGATTDGPPHAACLKFGDDQVGSDIWYNYDATVSGSITVSLCGSAYDTKVAVYDGCTCPVIVANLLACNDDFCGFQSEVTVPVVNGACYKIRVGGFNAAQGSGTITITKAPCPEDVNRDGVINVLDLIDLLLCFGNPAVPGCEREDLNRDGVVNVLDLIDLLLAFGTACP